MLLSDLLHRFSIFKEGLSLFGHVRLIRIRKRDGLDITETDTLRVSVTVIAFHRDPIMDIKERQVLHPMQSFLSMVTRLLFSGSLWQAFVGHTSTQ